MPTLTYTYRITIFPHQCIDTKNKENKRRNKQTSKQGKQNNYSCYCEKNRFLSDLTRTGCT